MTATARAGRTLWNPSHVKYRVSRPGWSVAAGILIVIGLGGQQTVTAPFRPGFVELPHDIRCGFASSSLTSAAAPGSETNGPVSGFWCALVQQRQLRRREIPLLSEGVKDGILQTRDFGKFQVIAEQIRFKQEGGPELYQFGGTIFGIQNDRLATLIAYLSRGRAPP